MTERNKVGVVTLFRSYNHGAFLQAYALQKYVSEKGYDPVFINVYGVKQNICALKTLKPRTQKKINNLMFNLGKLRIFSKAQKLFKRYRDHDTPLSAILLGSDEVWNIKNGTFVSVPEFFGCNLKSDRIISYAPAAAATKGVDILQKSQLCDGLKGIKCFSGRDENALDIVKSVVGIEATRVLDPTFLIDIEDEYLDIGYEKYIVVYSYNMQPEHRQEVLAFAAKCRLPVVSVGFYADWCDKSVNASPFQFLNLLKRAEYVVTDTFHGTMFSIIYGKNVAIYGLDKKKIYDFLETYNLRQRLVSEENNLESVLERPIVEDDLVEIRKYQEISKKFIAEALQA